MFHYNICRASLETLSVFLPDPGKSQNHLHATESAAWTGGRVSQQSDCMWQCTQGCAMQDEWGMENSYSSAICLGYVRMYVCVYVMRWKAKLILSSRHGFIVILFAAYKINTLHQERQYLGQSAAGATAKPDQFRHRPKTAWASIDVWVHGSFL